MTDAPFLPEPFINMSPPSPWQSLAVLPAVISYSFNDGYSNTVANADDDDGDVAGDFSFRRDECITSTLHHSKSPLAISLSSSSKLRLCCAKSSDCLAKEEGVVAEVVVVVSIDLAFVFEFGGTINGGGGRRLCRCGRGS